MKMYECSADDVVVVVLTGKQVFLAPHHDEKTIKKYENELKKMEKIFVMKLISKRKENNLFYTRSLPKPKRSFSSTPSSGSKEVSSYTSNSINNSIKTKISNSGVVKEVTTPKKKNNKKRVNSAPDLASLDTVQLNDQCDGEDAPPPKKKRMKGVGIPRSRSMQSFDSFAEMDIHAAGKRISNESYYHLVINCSVCLPMMPGDLLLSFSETLRKNYAEHNSIDNELPGEKSRGSLPSFFSSEATSMEAAKYNNCQQSSHLQNMDVKSENNVSAFSLFSHLATPSGKDNSDFFELEERIPFSDNKKEPEIFVDQSGENDIKEENVTSQNDVDDSGFFIGSGTDIE